MMNGGHIRTEEKMSETEKSRTAEQSLLIIEKGTGTRMSCQMTKLIMGTRNLGSDSCE